ncbi:hypothetical protein [Phenylobacterium sp.]|uniref:hypothetical protein n=1 Tax=Phenylobacterium sp. TaxID=1871053 RepID=UPI002C7074EF|nr:hypothetical protein [Phenylobacterium sp.]HLZ74891.1 hypothetical protein [Phenylobacterium sp.]
MRNVFNLVMRIISSLLGVLVACLGGIWILQGLNIAFKVGFMVGDKRWVAWGALAVVIGVSQIVWSNTRQG